MKPERRERHLQSISAAVFIENNEGKLLLLRQNESKGGLWGPPAGGVEYGETPENTAVREAKEEIKSEIVLKDLIGIYTVKRGDSYPSGMGFVYRGTLAEGEAIEVDGDEVVEARFFNHQELDLLIENNQIYKPEYNLPCISDWKSGSSYSPDVVKSLVDAEKLYI